MVLISDCCMKQDGEISDEQVEEVEYDQMSSWGLVASSSSSLHDGNKSGSTYVLSATVRNPNSLHHNGFLLPICEAEFQEAACITPSTTDEEERSESCHKPEVEKADEKHVQVEVKAASITEEQRSESNLTSTHKTQIKCKYLLSFSLVVCFSLVFFVFLFFRCHCQYHQGTGTTTKPGS